MEQDTLRKYGVVDIDNASVEAEYNQLLKSMGLEPDKNDGDLVNILQKTWVLMKMILMIRHWQLP